MKGTYDDIINLSHHVSAVHPQMSVANRAAQFSPFAALTGYNDAIKETARLTTERIELSESDISVLDMKLRMLEELIAEHPEIVITHYQPDEKKKGGAYITECGTLKRIDGAEHTIILMNGDKVFISDISDITCELIENML